MPLPYLTAPGNVKKALAAIISSATPHVVDSAFINNVLDIPGTSGKQIAIWLKKIGFIDSNGTPSEIYRRFRTPEGTAEAALNALHIGYAALYSREPRLHEMPDEKIAELIRSEIARGLGSNVVNLVRASIRGIASYADSSADRYKGNAGVRHLAPNSGFAMNRPDQVAIPLMSLRAAANAATPDQREVGGAVYNIYLTLPATSDEAVFTALFSALKKNLIG